MVRPAEGKAARKRRRLGWVGPPVSGGRRRWRNKVQRWWIDGVAARLVSVVVVEGGGGGGRGRQSRGGGRRRGRSGVLASAMGSPNLAYCEEWTPRRPPPRDALAVAEKSDRGLAEMGRVKGRS